MATVYKEIYILGKKIPKADKLGIHTTLQNKVLLAFESTISAAFAEIKVKKEYLEQARTSLETSKHLLRTEHQLSVIPEKSYIHVAGLLVEASKMNAAWLKNTEERIIKTATGQTKNSLF
jgi:hypothetical protein